MSLKTDRLLAKSRYYQVGEEVALRQAHLQQIGAAKTELEARALARYELEKAAYDFKQAQRQEREQQLGQGVRQYNRNLGRATVIK